MADLITIPARRGKGAFVERGRRVRLINTHGYQVVDTWAFNKADLREFMSMEHSRGTFLKLKPNTGESLFTNKRRPILTLLEDTTPGIHDTLVAACDRYRYEGLGFKGHHDNCTDNLASVFREMKLEQPETPCPFNIFQNSQPDGKTGAIEFFPPAAKPGDSVTLRAEMDILIVFSCCPQDLIPVNGPNGGEPREAHFEII